MKLTWIRPELPSIDDIDAEFIRHLFRSTEWPETGFVANLVATADGEFWGATGSSRDISNDTDLQALIGLRQAADGVLVSAATARQEKYHASRHAPLAIISRRARFANIPATSPEGSSAKPVYLLTRFRHCLWVSARFQRGLVRVIPLISFSAQFLAATMASLGWNRVLVEAGPSLTKHLVRVGLVRQIQLTITGAATGLTAEAVKSTATPALAKLGAGAFSLTSAVNIDGTYFSTWNAN